MEQQRIVSRQSHSIAYWIRGHGPAVLFIQGVGVHGSGWKPQIDQLASEYTCIWFDNRGLGKSTCDASTITVEQMAADAKDVLLEAGFDQAHVVGHSLGGLVAVQLALNDRSLVRSLSLLCTFGNGKLVAPLTLRMIWLGMRTQIGTRRMRRLGFLRLVSPRGPIENPDAMASYVGGLFGHDLAEQPPVTRWQLKAMRASDTTIRLHELRGLPTLVVSATQDPIAPPSLGKALADGIQGARFVEVKNASHGLPITHADQVNTLLDEHFQAAYEQGNSTRNVLPRSSSD